MTDPKNMYWDSCVFIRFLMREPTDNLADIDEYIEDTIKKKRKIYFSTISLVEIRPRFTAIAGFETAQKFFDSMSGNFEPIDPNPIIMGRAGELRNAVSTNPSDPADRKRVVGTPDAIHLVSCLYIRDVLGVSDVVFHTFDKGKGSTWEGKCVPLLGFENWFPEGARTERVSEVCGLERLQPTYPQVGLFAGGPDARAIVSPTRH